MLYAGCGLGPSAKWGGWHRIGGGTVADYLCGKPDLRNSYEYLSHRILNALEPGTVMPIRVIEQQEFLNYLDDTYGEYIGIVALYNFNKAMEKDD